MKPASFGGLFRGSRPFWLGLFAITWALSTWSFQLYKALDARWIIRFPAGLTVPVDQWISAFMAWLVEDATFGLFTFRDLTRFVSAVIEAPYDLVRALLIDGFALGQGQQAVEVAPSLSWIAVIAIIAALAWYAKNRALAMLAAVCFAYLAVFGQWASAMVTLASVLIAVPIGVAGGLALGIVSYRHAWFERMLRPLLDLMQTVPVFAYLVPILFLFGFGPVSALVATVIYAMPPMVRVSTVALHSVPEDVIEAGRMMGCKRRQLLWKVLVPTAMPSLMVGVNQVIMLSLNMVIIASMIGAGGLGFDVLAALRRLDFGAGFEAAALTGSENADEMRAGNQAPYFKSNKAGGILGGVSNGDPIVVRLAIKPTSSILTPRETVTTHNENTEIVTKGRHDPCVGIRAVPVAEAMMACVLADQFLRHRGQTGRDGPVGY